jgi:hypothetical protein
LLLLTRYYLLLFTTLCIADPQESNKVSVVFRGKIVQSSSPSIGDNDKLFEEEHLEIDSIPPVFSQRYGIIPLEFMYVLAIVNYTRLRHLSCWITAIRILQPFSPAFQELESQCFSSTSCLCSLMVKDFLIKDFYWNCLLKENIITLFLLQRKECLNVLSNRLFLFLSSKYQFFLIF